MLHFGSFLLSRLMSSVRVAVVAGLRVIDIAAHFAVLTVCLVLPVFMAIEAGKGGCRTGVVAGDA